MESELQWKYGSRFGWILHGQLIIIRICQILIQCYICLGWAFIHIKNIVLCLDKSN